jgi:hypothetical protein
LKERPAKNKGMITALVLAALVLGGEILGSLV